MMSTPLSSVSTQQATTSLSNKTTSSSSSTTSFSNYLLQVTQNDTPTYKPSMKEFMDKTGASWEEASVVYSNDSTDTRDWTKIMASDNPLNAAREATSQMYNATDRKYIGGYTPSDSQIYAKTDNFVYYKDNDGNDRLALTDKNGVLLRERNGSAETIKNNLLAFGFDLTQLDTLQSTLESKGITSPLFGDTSKNVFLDIEGVVDYTQEETPQNAYVVSYVDKYTQDRPTLTYTQILYPQTEVKQVVDNTTGNVENSVDGKTVSSTTATTSTTSAQSTQDTTAIKGFYQSYLNREPDAEGLAFWTQKLSEGVSLKEIENGFYNSVEFKSLLAQSATVSSSSTTTTASNASTSTSQSVAQSVQNATLEDLLKLI